MSGDEKPVGLSSDEEESNGDNDDEPPVIVARTHSPPSSSDGAGKGDDEKKDKKKIKKRSFRKKKGSKKTAVSSVQSTPLTEAKVEELMGLFDREFSNLDKAAAEASLRKHWPSLVVVRSEVEAHQQMLLAAPAASKGSRVGATALLTKHTCPVCSEAFENRAGLLLHLNSHKVASKQPIPTKPPTTTAETVTTTKGVPGSDTSTAEPTPTTSTTTTGPTTPTTTPPTTSSGTMAPIPSGGSSTSVAVPMRFSASFKPPAIKLPPPSAYNVSYFNW